ncbi:MAG: hypothetical protein ACK5Q5_11680 [Planctomycetaceae bacterium]
MHTEQRCYQVARATGLRLAGLLLVVLSGCGQPPLSPSGYELAKALHTAIQQQDAATLEQASDYLEQNRHGTQLTDDEYAFLSARIVQAQQGDWAASAHSLRALLAAQNVDL